MAFKLKMKQTLVCKERIQFSRLIESALKVFRATLKYIF